MDIVQLNIEINWLKSQLLKAKKQKHKENLLYQIKEIELKITLNKIL